MAFQLSPGVNVSEIDLTTVVPSVATSDGAFAGLFRWGPVGERTLVSTENQLISLFGKPTNHNPETFFTAANFLAYSNRLYIVRAANTTGATPKITANGSNNSSVLTLSNTTALSVGMYVTQLSNGSVGFTNVSSVSTVSIVSKNSSSITLSNAANTAFSNVDVYFARPETSYTAVGFDPTSPRTKAGANGIVDNLVAHIVKNDNDYTNKDGNFDPDVNWVAKFPGEIGNSLRISVCDTSDSFSSNVALTSAAIEFRTGSSIATVKFQGSTNATANTVASQISINDQVLAGNSAYGLQYLQVKSMTVVGNTTANVVVSGDVDVSNTIGFIATNNNPLSNGDIVKYVTAANNTALGGLSNNSNYYIVQANSSGFKVSVTPFGEEISLTSGTDKAGTFTANVNVLSIQFENPYRLRSDFTDTKIQRYWEFFNVVDTAPGQSEHVLFNGNTAAQDELHIVVVDELGKFTGTPGTILETHKNLSRATDAKGVDGTGIYYKNVVNQVSNYIWWANDRTTAPSATSELVASATSTSPANVQLTYGSDGSNEESVSIGVLAEGYDLFAKAEDIDISLVLQGKPIGGTTVVNGDTIRRFQLANYIINNICDTRRDCVALISPDKDTVLNNVGREANSVKNWRGAITSSSYAVLDSGYKYQYDRYNDIYRWVPMNGDIGGICARTDDTNDAWWSPAGFNRGQIKNLVKVAFNPNKSERDILYSNGVNPIVTFPGQGTVLYGDKTLQAKPSAFDRINVRRLFIVLEKAISTAAKYSLFEFNDAFTRAQFRNLVTPYLRTIQGRRGITDFKVVCDDTNNTAQIIDTNQFVGDIYIKPARSINFIQLNFIAVPSGVQFTEVVGKF